jgi:DNA-binding NtrC family response regulator
VEIESTLGEGTEVRLVFPIANSQSDTLAEPAKGLRAVIVEDDAQAMRHGERCLSKGGFEVQTATNFACAMSYFDTDISPEVVVTDLHLDNGETGWKIAEFCASRHPSAQIIIVSGRLPDDLPKFVKASAKIHCLEKPLTQRNLRAVLQS